MIRSYILRGPTGGVISTHYPVDVPGTPRAVVEKRAENEAHAQRERWYRSDQFIGAALTIEAEEMEW